MVSRKDQIHCCLLLGKARFVPDKFVSIPRLELIAATLSVKVASLLKKELDLIEIEEKFWTERKEVLSYITNDLRRFKTFVANRVQQIKGNTTSGQWCYIPAKKNPADSASRGLKVAQLNSVDCWFQGFLFLWEDTKYWSSGDVIIAELPNDDPEVKKDIASHSTLLSEDVIISAENKNSIRLKLKRVIALVLLYKQKLFKLIKANKELSPEIHTSCKEKLIGFREIEIAELEIIRSVQSRYSGKEIDLLSKQKKLEVNNRIFNLNLL